MRILVFGANTNVGKTLCSIGLCAAGVRRGPTSYLKPVETGVGDASRVREYLGDKLHACDALFSYERPVSPHLMTNPPGASVLRQLIEKWLKPHLCIIETAGGPLSPAPDKSLQADLYSKFDARCVLVGDVRLGGISATLCAKESLESRGVNVNAVLFVGDDEVGTVEYVSEQSPVYSVPSPPPTGPLHDWLLKSESAFDNLLHDLS